MPEAPRLHTTRLIPFESSALALRRHRLPRLWLALTLGAVLAVIGGVYWWERQLPERLSRAAAEGRLDDCLRYGDQLAALSWLPGRSPQEQGRCRRDRALQLWQQGRWEDALRLQGQLGASTAASPADRQRLDSWRQELQSRALERFSAGDLDGARALLHPLDVGGRRDGHVLAEEMGAIWERNRLQLERADGLIRQARWWEALDALNRLDHPWWQARASERRQQVNQGLARLRRQDQQRDSHGALPHSVPTDQLDAAVQRRIAAGVEEWQAFEQACRELGGRVVEAGPESACQR
jgi:hypothetical protein